MQTAMLASENTSGGTNGLPKGVDPSRPPRNYKDAMSRLDREEWDDAYRAEYQGFVDRDAFDIVKPPPGAKILGTTTVTEYKKTNGVTGGVIQ